MTKLLRQYFITGGDLSSISGSESDSDSSKDEETSSSMTNIEEDHFNGEDNSVMYSVAGSPFLYFSSQDGRYFAIYRSLVTNLKPAAVRDISSSDLLGSLVNLTQPQVWIVLMRAGGHFAGAVFRG